MDLKETVWRCVLVWPTCHNTYSLTHSVSYLPTVWNRVSPWEAYRFSVKKFPSFCETRKFITTFTTDRHVSLSLVKSVQSKPPHLTSSGSNLLFSCHLRLGLPRGLFPLGFPSNTPYAALLFPIHAACPNHLVLRVLITRIIFGEEYRPLISS